MGERATTEYRMESKLASRQGTEVLYIDPAFSFRRMPEEFQPPEARMPEQNTLCFLLQSTVRITEELLLQGDPIYWPTIFDTICILYIVGDNFPSLDDSSPPYALIRDVLGTALRHLTKLFLFCCKEFHPLNSEMDTQWLRLIFGSSTTPLDHYEDINNIWISEFYDGK